MKKISTKIVLMSVVNTIIVAMANVTASLLNNKNTGANTASQAAGATGAPDMAMNGVLGMPNTVLYGLIISLVIGVVIAYFMGKYISKPIIKVTELTARTSNLDLVEDVAFEKSMNYKDESGAMANALMETRSVLRKMINNLQAVSNTLSSHSNSLSTSSEEYVNKMAQVATAINEVTEGNNNQAQTIGQINQTLAEIADLVENITSDAISGAKNAKQSLKVIEDGQSAVDIQVKKMEQNIAISRETSKSIEELNQMIKQVESTINVITSIADQTNLLALNAAIEAARAGESGKGFAVVADEIRKLAEDSSVAAKEIISVINNTTVKTENAVQNISTSNTLVEEQKNALGITQDSFNKIKNTYEVIVNSFNATANSLENANEKTRQIAAQTQDMAAIAEESAASMEEISATVEDQKSSVELMAKSSKELSNLSDELSSEIGKFKVK
jgi:Methyl-accepting chemotaxis protein